MFLTTTLFVAATLAVCAVAVKVANLLDVVTAALQN